MKNKRKTSTTKTPVTQNPNKINSFAYRFLYALKKRKLLTADIAGLTGVGQNSLSLYANGKSIPSRERIIILANALRVDPAWLLGFTPLAAINRYSDEEPYLDEQLKIAKGICKRQTNRTPVTPNPNKINSFAYRFLYALKKRKLLTADIADLTGVGQNSLSLYVNGKSIPSRERIIILANALQVDPAWLMGFTPLTAINR